jgi:hypothetical protein
MSRFDPHGKALDRVLARAATDLDFRKRLLVDPHAALAEVLGRTPGRWRVKFVEKGPDLDALIVLPDLRVGNALADSELDRVAGGEGADWQPLSDDDDSEPR